MALTWQNVAAPDFSGAIQAQKVAGDSMNNGFNAIRDALASFEAQKMAQAKFGDEHRRSLITDDTARLNNNGLGIRNNSAQFELDSTKRDDALTQSRLAAQPEAAKLLAEIRLMANSGDPVQIEEASARVAGNTDLWTRIGKTAEQVSGMIDAERTAGKTAFGYKQDVLNNGKFWENENISKEAQSTAFDAVNNLPTADMALSSVQNNTDIRDPRIKVQAGKMIQEFADGKFFATPSADQQYLDANAPITQEAPADTGNTGFDAAKNLLRQEEGILSNPRWDKTAFRAGYGSDTTTLSDGRVVPITQGMHVSTEDAERDLNYRLTSREGKQAREQLGGLWDTLPANVQAPLYSVAYNYGSLPKSVVAAVKTGDTAKIADAVRALSANPDRRAREADMILGGAVNTTPRDPNSVNQNDAPRNNADSMLANSVDNFPQVNPDLSAANQSYQRRQRTTAINNAIADITSTLDGGITSKSAIVEGLSAGWDYMSATPEEGVARRDMRQKHRDTADFIAANADYLRANPSEIAAVQKDPIAFAENFGNTPSQKKWLASKEANTLSASTKAAADKNSADVSTDGVSRSRTMQDTQKDVQNLIDQSMMDRTRQPNAALLKSIKDASSSEEFAPEVAKRLTAPEGVIPSGNTDAVLAAINETIKLSNNSLSPAAAGAIVANSMEGKDVSSSWDPGLLPSSWLNFSKDAWLTDKENPEAALRANMGKVKQTLKDLGQNVDGSIDTSKAVAQYSSKRASDIPATELPKIQQFLLAAAAEAGSLRAAIARGRGTPEIARALKEAEAKVQRFQAIVDQIDSGPVPATSIYTDAAQGLPGK